MKIFTKHSIARLSLIKFYFIQSDQRVPVVTNKVKVSLEELIHQGFELFPALKVYNRRLW